MLKYVVKEDEEVVGVFWNVYQAIALNDRYLAYGRNSTIDIESVPDDSED